MNKTVSTVKRSNNIDALKALCAFLVVFIHCEYPYKSAVLPITDVAVPLFFCISGYFVFGSGRSRKRIVRIVWLLCWVILLYFIKTEVYRIIFFHEVYIPSVQALKNLFFFNDVSVAIHLWYLPAYLYVLLIAFFIDRFNLWKIAFCSILPLLFTGVIIRYSISTSCPEQIQFWRNAYFVGLPYFLIGSMIGAVQMKFSPPPLLRIIHL